LSFDQFPWFRDASIGQLSNVERPHPGHLHWPELDIDLSEESVEHPGRFPLVSRVRIDRTRRPSRKHARQPTKRNRKRG
jgi:hypothetical protein